MTNKDDELAALKARVEELERKAEPPPKSTFVPMTDAEWIDRQHQIREGNMRYAMPPSVVRDYAAQDDRMYKEVTLRDARAPTGPSSAGVIPSTQQLSNVHVGGSATPGWADPTPLGPSPHQRYVDAQLDAADARDRTELAQRIAAQEAAMRAAQGKKEKSK
jgi:hypothetical protein